mmetsp:Transcript_29115/g.97534  ORF Transcript_29115/g.97534 Transcript_29115/m.97534 type:complete len:317 (+) Transcript_29115:111-1061(+)
MLARGGAPEPPQPAARASHPLGRAPPRLVGGRGATAEQRQGVRADGGAESGGGRGGSDGLGRRGGGCGSRPPRLPPRLPLGRAAEPVVCCYRTAYCVAAPAAEVVRRGAEQGDGGCVEVASKEGLPIVGAKDVDPLAHVHREQLEDGADGDGGPSGHVDDCDALRAARVHARHHLQLHAGEAEDGRLQDVPRAEACHVEDLVRAEQSAARGALLVEGRALLLEQRRVEGAELCLAIRLPHEGRHVVRARPLDLDVVPAAGGAAPNAEHEEAGRPLALVEIGRRGERRARRGGAVAALPIARRVDQRCQMLRRLVSS